ncbi:MAG: hypothetical protein ABIP30_15690 [Ferruginibacter sp.]
MRVFLLLTGAICLMVTSCKKVADKPQSKTDYIPIISANTTSYAALGEDITSKVKMGSYSYNADVKFINFDVKKIAERNYDIRAVGFYSNINNSISLPVVATFDTTLLIRPTVMGQYILRFYNSLQLVQTDTVQVK